MRQFCCSYIFKKRCKVHPFCIPFYNFALIYFSSLPSICLDDTIPADQLRHARVAIQWTDIASVVIAYQGPLHKCKIILSASRDCRAIVFGNVFRFFLEWTLFYKFLPIPSLTKASQVSRLSVDFSLSYNAAIICSVAHWSSWKSISFQVDPTSSLSETKSSSHTSVPFALQFRGFCFIALQK